MLPNGSFSFRVKCSYALHRELQAVSSSLGPVSLSDTFFTASLVAAMVDAVDSELCGLGSTYQPAQSSCTASSIADSPVMTKSLGL